MKFVEESYGRFLRLSFAFLNPFKKAVIKTQCQVHKHLNVQSLLVLNNDGYTEISNFFRGYLIPLNNGAVWADQDFKSSQHFYNPHTKKGLYGRLNANDLGLGYYEKALDLWKIGEYDKSIYYFGAAVHILQDMTIPQHANVRLLDNHRQYETFVKKTYRYVEEFKAEKGILLFDSYEDYIRFNTRTAMKVYKRFKKINEDQQRFYRITKCILPLAERTTAGCMITFYNSIFNEADQTKYH